jgi:hypothetical protein
MASSSLRAGLQILLWVLIIALSYVLYRSITEPYVLIERQQELTDLTRMRMDKIRQVAIHFESQYDRFPATLDSLAMYAMQDSAFLTVRDSVLGMSFPYDSLVFSPRTGKRFSYAINDTARVNTYLLQDPDSNDKIGTLLADVTLVNAASWE